MSIDPTMPRLTELRAWHALRKADAAEALAILDAEPLASARLRLLHQVVRMRAGQLAQAHLELHGWSRQPGCPALARVLLAWLDVQAGDTQGARRALHRNLEQYGDADTLMMLMLMDLAEDLPAAAQRHATMLAHRFAHHQATASMLRSLGLSRQIDPAAVPLEMVDELAGQLLSRPHVIGSLIVAQKLKPNPARIELLRRALVRIVDDLAEPVEAMAGLGRLALLAGDRDEARRWARRGLKLQPLDVRLALLLNEAVEQPVDAGDEPILDTMQRIAAARPGYPDVQRALIDRYHQAGRDHHARAHLQAWLDNQPDQPLAEQTRKELAA
jgi:tetratricopeptide (TPR) repeat protein